MKTPTTRLSAHCLLLAIMMIAAGCDKPAPPADKQAQPVTPAGRPASQPPTAGSPAAQPNIILLLADDLGWTDVASARLNQGHGSRYHDTPNIDAIARSGMVFTRAYMQQNCAPSRASLITGRYAPAHRVYNVGGTDRALPDLRASTPIIPAPSLPTLTPGGQTLAHHLRAAGYTTAHFGKLSGWAEGDGSSAGEFGFDIDYSVARKLTVEAGGKAATLSYQAMESNGAWHFAAPAYDRFAAPYNTAYIRRELLPVANDFSPQQLQGEAKHLTDAIADAVIATLHERRGEPLFMLVSFHAVHSDLTPRRDILEKYQQRDSSDPRHSDPVYAAMVETLDQAVGRIMRAVTGNQSDHDTLVIFTSDNGAREDFSSNAPLRGTKGEFYEGSLRVPFVAHWPGMIPPSSTDEPIHVVDLAPTLLDAGNAAAMTSDGVSLLPLLTGDPATLRRPLYWHFPGYMDTRLAPTSMVVSRTPAGIMKLMYHYENGAWEMYNLDRDLAETTNLAERGEHRETATALAEELIAWLTESGAERGQWRGSGEPVALPTPPG